MVYYMHAFGQRDASSEDDTTTTISSLEDAGSQPDLFSDASTSDDASFAFGKKSGKKDKFMAQILCAAKLGFLAGILMILLGYLSVTLLNQDWFRKEDPVSRKKLVDWQKLLMYAGVVFLVVTIGAYLIAANKSGH